MANSKYNTQQTLERFLKLDNNALNCWCLELHMVRRIDAGDSTDNY
jgi:hypothetical protein